MPIRQRTILLLGASPRELPPLRLDEERREIMDALRSAATPSPYRLEFVGAVRPQDFQRAMLDFEPAIVHFAGHGTEAGLALEDLIGGRQIVDIEAIADLIGLFASHVECVILTACDSAAQALAIARHVPYAIGTHRKVSDPAAIIYSRAFYTALAAGQAIPFAHEIARNALRSEAPAEQADFFLEKGRQPAKSGGPERASDVLSYSVVSALDGSEVRELVERYRRRVDVEPGDGFAHLNIGLLYLHLKDYGRAEKAFRLAVEHAPEHAAPHYYLALARIGGRRLRVLPHVEIAAIERHLTRAIELDPTAATYYYCQALVKYDYYHGNRLPAKPPSYSELLQAARAKRPDPGEAERLLAAVSVVEDGLRALIKRSE